MILALAFRLLPLAPLIASLASCGPPADEAQRSGEASLAVGVADAGANQLVIRSVAPARPVTTTDERPHLVYELFFQNASAATIQITGIDVFGSKRHLPIARYEGASLATILLVLGGDAATGTISPGGIAFAFFDIALPTERHPPDHFQHRIKTISNDLSAVMTAPIVPVVSEEPVRVGPPLRGDGLFDLGGCCTSAHTRAVLALNDDLFLSQRYAVDFVRVNESGPFEGDPAQNQSYLLYGADVLAVSAGPIVDVRDGMPENIPTEPLPPFDLETATGNFVVQQLDDRRFALYAHLQPGSIAVRPGDRVRRGQVIGRVGNSGNSTQPHLHFHVMAGAAPLLSDGLPFVFDRFRLEATVDLTAPTPVVVPVPPPQQRRNRLPMTGDLIAFPWRNF